MMNCPGHTFQDAASPTAALVSVSRTYMFESRLHWNGMLITHRDQVPTQPLLTPQGLVSWWW